MARLSADPEYLRLAAQAARSGRILGAAVEQRLQEYASPALTRTRGTLCLRGSHARRDGTAESDIDLFFLADDVSHEICQDLVTDLQPHFEPRISIQSCHTCFTTLEQECLAIWLSLLHMRYLAGDRSALRRFAAQAWEILRARPLSYLLSLYSLDPLRRHNAPEHLDSLTRGYGGIVDYEFARLLAHWLEIRGTGLNPELRNIFSRLTGLYRYLVTYKHLAAAPPHPGHWFAAAEACARFRRALHNGLGASVSLAIESEPGRN